MCSQRWESLIWNKIKSKLEDIGLSLGQWYIKHSLPPPPHPLPHLPPPQSLLTFLDFRPTALESPVEGAENFCFDKFSRHLYVAQNGPGLVASIENQSPSNLSQSLMYIWITWEILLKMQGWSLRFSISNELSCKGSAAALCWRIKTIKWCLLKRSEEDFIRGDIAIL